MEYRGRIPKVGDTVGAKGHNGVFKVEAGDEKVRTVQLRLTNGAGPPVRDVPWTALAFTD